MIIYDTAFRIVELSLLAYAFWGLSRGMKTRQEHLTIIGGEQYRAYYWLVAAVFADVVYKMIGHIQDPDKYTVGPTAYGLLFVSVYVAYTSNHRRAGDEGRQQEGPSGLG